MNEKVKQAFKFLCEQYVKDLNRYENKEIAKDYFYNPKYECGFKINGENVYFADILKAFDNMEELIKGKDEYIAKLCNDRAELKAQNKILKEELDAVNDFRKNYKFYLDELNELREFAKYFTTCYIVHDNDMWVGKRYFERDVCGDKKFDLVKKVVEKYGN